VELGVIGFMKAAFGLRLAPDFLAFGALLVAAFFIVFLAADLRPPAFFDLPFLDAIDESSNHWVTLSSAHLASEARQREDAQAENDLSTDFTRETRFFWGSSRLRNNAVLYAPEETRIR